MTGGAPELRNHQTPLKYLCSTFVIPLQYRVSFTAVISLILANLMVHPVACTVFLRVRVWVICYSHQIVLMLAT